MRPALFIDRDNTINRDPGYVHELKDLDIFSGVADLIREYNEKGFLVIVLSNQSGINRGYFKKEEMDSFNDAIQERLKKEGARIDAFYYCPHTPTEGCSCRKPKTGMAEAAMKDFDVDLKNSIMVGDRDDIDGELARRLKISYKIIRR
jgi:D,D-heptose 1,7-bisphosphate phosphatase